MAIIRAKLTAAERRAGLDLRDVLGTRKTRKPRGATRKPAPIGLFPRAPVPKKARTKLEQLVDDYLDKHATCVQAGHVWDRAKRDGEPEREIAAKLNKFANAHSARAAAFRALAVARGRR